MAGQVSQPVSSTNNRFTKEEAPAPYVKRSYNTQGPAVVPLNRSQLLDDGQKTDELYQSEIYDKKDSSSEEAEKKNNEADLYQAKSFQILSPVNITYGICFLSFAISCVCWFLNSFSSPKEAECKAP